MSLLPQDWNLAQLRNACLSINLTDRNLLSNEVLPAASGRLVAERPEHWQTWLIGLGFITVISFSSIIGIALLPLLKGKFYDRTLTLFIGLGVGSLSGSAIFHLLPGAFDAHEGSVWKSWTAVAGIYLFYIIDRALTFFFELQARRRARNQIDPTAAFAQYANKHSHNHNDDKNEGNEIANVAWMVIFGDALHNFIDGLSIGAAFVESLLAGISISIAVICEEVPHELGDVAILLKAGMTRLQAAKYNLLSALTCYAGFVLGVLLGDLSPQASSYVLALAGGLFLYISLAHIIPEMNEQFEQHIKQSLSAGIETMCLQSAGVLIGLVVMFIMAHYGEKISVAQ
uniref:Uncharacterized protein n=1 Tax=Plectus sambesii TaxID=2011161 RepID=A0A914X754_9BILA